MKTKKSFKEATKLAKIFNNVVEWNGYTLGTVQFHEDREWKVIPENVDWDTIADREYKPIAEFHTQEELWQYLKKELTCPECEEEYEEESRVEAGMKCGKCAYPYGD